MIEYVWIVLSAVIIGVPILYYILNKMAIKKMPQHRKDRSCKPRVSLILPTYNEKKLIKQKLENTLSLDYPKELLEIIVIDSASTDGTQGIIKKFVEEHRDLRIVFIAEEKRAGKAIALNNALPSCHGEIVGMSDIDSFLDKNAMSEAVANFADERVGAVTGRQILMNPDDARSTKFEKSYRDIFLVWRLGESMRYSDFIFHGELALFRRSALENFNIGCDDSGTAMDMIQKGYRAIYDADTLLYENAPPTLRARFNQKSRRGRSIIEVVLRNLKGFRNPKVPPAFKLTHLVNLYLHAISPVLVLAWIIITPFVMLKHPMLLFLLLAGILFTLIVRRIGYFVWSFIESQLILINSLWLYLKGERYIVWEKVDETRGV
jgi:cellulose synthase/poly-beta-1,6-N-acetylglucosamine synthase-like glycosyltransferase